jgi:hypothetical protein
MSSFGMHIVVVAGSRHRGWRDGLPWSKQLGSPEDAEYLDALFSSLQEEHGAKLLIMSIGCDTGFGKLVKRVAEDKGIAFGEYLVILGNGVPKPYYELFFLGRHAALLDIGKEFWVFPVKSRMSNVEDLIQRLQMTRDRRYKVIDEGFQVTDWSQHFDAEFAGGKGKAETASELPKRK